MQQEIYAALLFFFFPPPRIRGPGRRICNGIMSQRDCWLFGVWLVPGSNLSPATDFPVILVSLAMKIPGWDPKIRTNRFLLHHPLQTHYPRITLPFDGTQPVLPVITQSPIEIKSSLSTPLTLWRRNYFFLILAHFVYKM